VLSRFELPEKLPAYEELEKYLMQDKKNTGKQVNFSLLERVGSCGYDQSVSAGQIKKSLEAFMQKEIVQ